MARDRHNLLRGQGLLRQGITSASNRWKTYALQQRHLFVSQRKSGKGGDL
jgi:hypothetical protein